MSPSNRIVRWVKLDRPASPKVNHPSAYNLVNQIARLPERRPSEKMSGKYGDLIRQAKQPEDSSTNLPDNQKTRKDDPEVNLCVKVKRSLRQHWAAEAKRRGITMTSVIVEALSEQFGTPDD